MHDQITRAHQRSRVRPDERALPPSYAMGLAHAPSWRVRSSPWSAPLHVHVPCRRTQWSQHAQMMPALIGGRVLRVWWTQALETGTARRETLFLAAANLAFVLDELRLTLIRRARVSLLDEHRRAPMYDLPLQPSPNRMLCCSSCARWLGPTLHARDWMYHAPARNEVRVQLYGWLVAARAASSALCSHPVARGALGGVCVRLARVRGVACDFSKCSIETT